MRYRFYLDVNISYLSSALVCLHKQGIDEAELALRGWFEVLGTAARGKDRRDFGACRGLARWHHKSVPELLAQEIDLCSSRTLILRIALATLLQILADELVSFLAR